MGAPAVCFASPDEVFAATAAFGFWVFGVVFAAVFGFVVVGRDVEDDEDDDVEPPVNGRL